MKKEYRNISWTTAVGVSVMIVFLLIFISEQQSHPGCYLLACVIHFLNDTPTQNQPNTSDLIKKPITQNSLLTKDQIMQRISNHISSIHYSLGDEIQGTMGNASEMHYARTIYDESGNDIGLIMVWTNADKVYHIEISSFYGVDTTRIPTAVGILTLSAQAIMPEWNDNIHPSIAELIEQSLKNKNGKADTMINDKKITYAHNDVVGWLTLDVKFINTNP